MILYCLHDKKAETWSFPQTTHNPATAIREFEHMAKRPEFPLADIELVKVADFDNNSGVVTACRPLQVLLKGSEYGSGN